MKVDARNLFGQARFSSPTLPGDTLQIDMWQEGQRIHVQTVNKDTNKAVLTGGYVDLKAVVVLRESRAKL